MNLDIRIDGYQNRKNWSRRIFRLRLVPAAVLILLTIATAPSASAVVPPSPPAYGVRMEDTWIPMKDGVRLAVKLYMPEGAKAGDKFPAVLEYHPYRKDDGSAAVTTPCMPTLPGAVMYVPASTSGVLAGVREFLRSRIFRAGTLDASQIIVWLAASALVKGQRRVDGYRRERLQFSSDGHVTRAGTEGNHCRGRHRRTLSRRCALHGRYRARR